MQAAKVELVLTDLLAAEGEGERGAVIRRRNALLSGQPAQGDEPARPGLAAWTIFRPILARHLDSLRRPATQATSLTGQIRQSNTRHDHLGSALWHATQAVEQDPDASAEAREAAIRVRAAFVPARSDLNLTDAHEIANARRRKPLLQGMADDLRRVPAADGRTALDVATAMIAAAEARAALMGDRSATPAAPAGEGAAWSRALGALLDFRQTLVRKLESRDDLDDLEALVFGLFDAQRG